MRWARHKAIVTACVLGSTAFIGSATPAPAEGLFERLFGGFHRHVQRPAADFAEPVNSFARAIDDDPQPRRVEPRHASRGFCVRTCDGRYFPVQASGKASAAEMCQAFCPAGHAKVYSGSDIDYAVASDGSRYADLDTAFLYRKQLVNGCTCNGRDSHGLAHINTAEDPTLKPGDVVATREGLVAYTGRKDDAKFTPVQSYSGFSKDYRAKLLAMKLMPPTPGAPAPVMSSIPDAKGGNSRSAELRR
jgi:hypothetical protein